MCGCNRWTPGFKQNVVASRVHTTQALAQLIQKSKHPRPKVFASISGVGFYPPSEDKEYTEQSEGGHGDFLAELCRDWEAAGDLKSVEDVRRVVIRSGVVLGKGGGLINQMYWPFFFGLGGPVGPGHQYLPWIHLEDLTSLFAFAISQPQVAGVLNGVAPEVVTSRQFAKTLGKAMCRPALLPMPARVMDLLLHPERASMVTKGQKVLPSRTLELGFKFQYPELLEACRACL
ncbi:SDR39U1 [Cordylochernes scorpioides]|uniref:SDR39U1 n=1 Tax=Cordylochernes scorpioides TaxID=51811 RepID=A0ABY6KFS9_9ARAC|nr:SDR39U1 [Cordylochernes scorpioides]